MDTWVTVITALAAAVIGGWVGASGQFRTERRLRSLDLAWDFRLNLHNLEQDVLDPKDWRAPFDRLNWLRVAASDPRLGLGSKDVKVFFAEIVEVMTQAKDASPTVTEQLYVRIIKAVRKLDELAVERLKKLA